MSGIVGARGSGCGFDMTAPGFDRYRVLPRRVPEAIRRAILARAPIRTPRLLDLGAGTGRIGWPFVAARDDYVGVDLSLGMLRAFVAREDLGPRVPRLVQADGGQLPFADASFDIVMLIQVFGGLRSWRPILADAHRVLRRSGALVLGRTMMPDGGVDAQMKQRLRAILTEMEVGPSPGNASREAEILLASAASHASCEIAAQWQTTRNAREFIDRHRTGARFSALPEAVKDEALRRLAAWAAKTFGSLDADAREQHRFELRIFKFHSGAGH